MFGVICSSINTQKVAITKFRLGSYRQSTHRDISNNREPLYIMVDTAKWKLKLRFIYTATLLLVSSSSDPQWHSFCLRQLKLCSLWLFIVILFSKEDTVREGESIIYVMTVATWRECHLLMSAGSCDAAGRVRIAAFFSSKLTKLRTTRLRAIICCLSMLMTAPFDPTASIWPASKR